MMSGTNDGRYRRDMNFRIMAMVTALAGTVLGARFIFSGASILKDWGLAAEAGSLVIARRLGALYLGLALMFFLGRDAGPSDLRSGLSLGVGVASALLAGLGLFELSAGRVTTGIIVPSVAELVLAAGFGWAWWAGR